MQQRAAAALIAFTFIAVLAACSRAAPAPPTDQRVSFVSADFAVLTVNADGTGTQRLIGPPSGGATFASASGQQAGNASYTWPTWAPDGSRLALSRVPGFALSAPSALVTLEADGTNEQAAYQTTRGLVELVASGMPYYVQWSPDSERLSFIAPRQDGRGLALYDSPPVGDGPDEIVRDAPIYYTWAPDSSFAIVHRGERLLLYDPTRGAAEDLERPSARYRVPAVSPDSGSVAYLVDEAGQSHLTIMEVRSKDERRVWTSEDDAVFLWSPTEQLIAASQAARTGFPGYRGVTLIDPAGGDAKELIAEPVLAFFFSPNGERLAAVVADTESRTLRWLIVDVRSGKSRRSEPFLPSSDFATLLQFFDQFAASHSPWSADSAHLVFAGTLPEETSSTSRVIVVNAGDATMTPIAEGRLAFWVPLPG